MSSSMRIEPVQAENLSRAEALTELAAFLDQVADSTAGADASRVNISAGTNYQLELVRCSLEGRAPPPPPAPFEATETQEETVPDSTTTGGDVADEQQDAAEPIVITQEDAGPGSLETQIVMMDTDELPAESPKKKKKSKKAKKSK